MSALRRLLCWAALGPAGIVPACTSMSDGAPAAAAEVQTVVAFAPGDFLESVVATRDGNLYVCVTRASGVTDVVRVRGSDRTTVATLPATCNLAPRADGSLWASAGGPGGQSSLWRVEPTSGEVALVANLPAGVWANGVVALPEGGAALVADSASGRLWRLRAPAYAPEMWLEHALLQADPAPPDLPAANGIEVVVGAVLVSNSDARRLVRVALATDGAAGEVREVANGSAIDDFAVAADGTVFGATHLFNTVVRLGDGEAVDILTATEGAIGPSAVDIGRAPGDEFSLYVVTDGNLFGRQVGGSVDPVVAPALLRVRGAVR